MITPLVTGSNTVTLPHGQRLTVNEGVVASVSQGSYLLIDVDQPGSRVYMILFNERDPTERLSLSHTRIAQGHLFLGPMSNLISNRRSILARVCEDDVRAHDILTSSTANVTFPESVVEELDAHGVPPWSLPDGIDLFSRVKVDKEGYFHHEGSPARTGDRLALLLATDVLFAMTVREGAVRVSVLRKMVPYGTQEHA